MLSNFQHTTCNMPPTRQKNKSICRGCLDNSKGRKDSLSNSLSDQSKHDRKLGRHYVWDYAVMSSYKFKRKMSFEVELSSLENIGSFLSKLTYNLISPAQETSFSSELFSQLDTSI